MNILFTVLRFHFFRGLGGPELIILFLLLFAILLIPQIFYLITLQRTMELVSPDLRRMSPGQVWLVFIPLFGIVWNFIMIGHIADSVALEFRRRNIPYDEERPGYQTGLTMCILNICGIIPFIGGLFALIGIVFWIIYWTKIAGYKRQLENSQFFYPPFPPPPNQGYHY